MFKAVLFDFGGVITTSPFDAFATYEKEISLPDGIIRKINSTNPDSNAWAKFERNDVQREEFKKLLEMSQKKVWEVDSKIEETEVFISRLFESKRWIDWLQIYMDKVDEWEGLTDVKLKKDLLLQYVEILLQFLPHFF